MPHAGLDLTSYKGYLLPLRLWHILGILCIGQTWESLEAVQGEVAIVLFG